MKIAQPDPKRRSALLRRPVIATSSAGVAESRSGPRNRAVLWNEPSLLRMTPVSTSAAQGRKSVRLWLRLRYSARFIIGESSRHQVLRVAQMPAHDFDEGGIAFSGPDRRQVADQPDRGADDPKAKAQPNGGGERAVDDRHRPRRAAEQDRLSQSAMDRCIEAGDWILMLHQTSAPPPNWKKDRKKELAANAIDRPKTIWISRRKPPEVSPKARVRPVMMMTMTERTLATGPWIESRICVSGCSHGMLDPAA